MGIVLVSFINTLTQFSIFICILLLEIFSTLSNPQVIKEWWSCHLLKQIFNNLIYNFRDLSFLQVTEEYKILQLASLNLLKYFVSNVPELFGGTTFDIRLGEENDSHKCEFFSSVQSLSRVWLFATPWTAACQASLFITNSQSLLILVSKASL